jgi:hypothetical protein
MGDDHITSRTSACLLEPADAMAVVQALDQAISRTNAKREGN